MTIAVVGLVSLAGALLALLTAALYRLEKTNKSLHKAALALASQNEIVGRLQEALERSKFDREALERALNAAEEILYVPKPITSAEDAIAVARNAIRGLREMSRASEPRASDHHGGEDPPVHGTDP